MRVEMAGAPPVLSAPPPDHAAFFATLPPTDLLPMEAALRQILVDWLRAKPGPFPLKEWIDRRIGGEVESRPGLNGSMEICFRGTMPPVPLSNMVASLPPLSSIGQPMRPQPPGTAPPAAAVAAGGKAEEDFFRRLPGDNFSSAEAALRESVFEFLATWKSQELATLADMNVNPKVVNCKGQFLPPNVTLRSWVEKRIGGEVELKPGKKKGDLIVGLTPEGKRLVKEKYQQLRSSQQASSNGSSAAAAPESNKSADQFFESLPEDELTGTELALREEIINFLSRLQQQRKPKATVGELGADAKVAKCRKTLLPQTVKLKTWIERRVGGEIEIAPGKNPGDPLVFFRKGSGLEDASDDDMEAFLADLPEDALLDAEQDLRVMVLEYLQNKGQVALPDFLSAFQKDPRLAGKRRNLLPEHVPLEIWIDRRIGGEVEITPKDNRGRQFARLRDGEAAAMQDDVHGGDYEEEAEQERWFTTLPDDEFLPEEEALREALLNYLNRRGQSTAVGVEKARSDDKVGHATKALLPPGCPVDLATWVQRRIGGEIEVSEKRGGKERTIQLVRAQPPDAKRRRA